MTEFKMSDLPKEERRIYKKLMDKYKDSPARKSEQSRIKHAIEVDGMLPSALEKWEEMF